MEETVKARVRLDYKGYARPGKLFIRHKTAVEVSEEAREREAAGIKHLVDQGIRVEDVDATPETYVLVDPLTDEEVAYSPLYVTLTADSINDLIEFVICDEFRVVEILEPLKFDLSAREVGRFIAVANDRVKTVAQLIARHTERY